MPKDAPNNFPRKGDSNPVIRDHLDHLKTNNPAPITSMDYTIGGSTQSAVHSSLEAERHYTIQTGERILKRASDNLDHNFTFSSLKGQSKAQFQAAKADYIKTQQASVEINQQQSPHTERAMSKEQYIARQQDAAHAPVQNYKQEPSR